MTDWMSTFRAMGKAAQEVISGLWGRGEFAEEIARGAGGDMTTRLDRAIEERVVGMVPDGVLILSEEAGLMGDDTSDWMVVIDPLDGSTNAMRGIPHFCISIALAKAPFRLENVEVACIRHLLTGVEYTAIKGEGIRKNGERVRPSDRLWIVATEIYPDVPDAMIKTLLPLQCVTKVRCLGSVAMDLAFVADGTVDAFVDLRNRGRYFDIVGGYLLLKESGCVITDEAGQDISGISIDLRGRGNVIASCCKDVHDTLLSLLR